MEQNHFRQHILYYSIFIFLVNITCFSQSGWYQISHPDSYPLNIYFKDSDNGIIFGYKTSNGGQNWINMNGGYGYGLSFPNQNTGYAVGIGHLSKTTNFGDNWTNLSVPGFEAYYGISFPNVNTGFICGASSKIYRTTNDGLNWIGESPIYSDRIVFSKISFLNSSLGFCVGSNQSNQISDTDLVLRTTNGGNYWDVIKLINSNYRFQSLFIINSNEVVIGGRTIFKTTDSGNTWAPKYSPTANVIQSIFFPSANTGYGVCAYSDIIKTTDGGDNWFKQIPVTGNDLNTVFFVNDYTGYACGANGTVLKTTNGGGPPIGIEPIGTEVPDKFSLSQNYPNPFNPITTINYDLPVSGYVKLTIFDILGKEIKVLVSEKQSAGKYKIEWDASNYPSGIYFYRLTAGDPSVSSGQGFVDTKKMVLVK